MEYFDEGHLQNAFEPESDGRTLEQIKQKGSAWKRDLDQGQISIDCTNVDSLTIYGNNGIVAGSKSVVNFKGGVFVRNHAIACFCLRQDHSNGALWAHYLQQPLSLRDF